MVCLTSSAVLALCVLWRCMSCVLSGCEFPYYMQTNGTARDWAGRIKEQNTEVTLEINVASGTMTTVSTDSTASSYSRQCLRSMGSDKYLVSHEESGAAQKRFTCIQFVRRSNNVIQLRAAPLSDIMNANFLCDDNKMELDDWLIIDREHVATDHHQCALEGGFSMMIYDSLHGQGICDGYKGETRMESECVRGEGLYFYFRHQNCVPENMYMYHTQRTLCLANWREGRYTFILLRHERLQYMWILRYPTTLGESFSAHLLKDLKADTDDHISDTNNYLRLDAVRDVSRPVTALCVDEYEICSLWLKPCSSGPLMALTCPRTCGICNATRPRVCRFNATWQGDWTAPSRPPGVAVSVNETTLRVERATGAETFHCVEWQVPDTAKPGKRHVANQMLVKEFNNGCRPRYSCAKFVQKSTSVMFFKLSESRTWPFANSPSDPMDCRHFAFQKDIAIKPNYYRNKLLRLLVAEEGASVQCHLPGDLDDYTVRYPDGKRCRCSLAQSGQGTEISLRTHDCGARPIDQYFTCLDSSRILPSHHLLLVTRTFGRPEEILCWLFPRSEHRSFYLLSAEQCNEAAARRISKDRLKPLASFSKLRRTVRLGGNATHPNMTVLPSASTPTPTVRTYDYTANADDRRPVVWDNATTVAPSTDSVGTKGFVVIVFIMLFFMVQIPCIMKLC